MWRLGKSWTSFQCLAAFSIRSLDAINVHSLSDFKPRFVELGIIVKSQAIGQTGLFESLYDPW